MSRRDPYWKRLQVLLNSEPLKTLEGIRSTMEKLGRLAREQGLIE